MTDLRWALSRRMALAGGLAWPLGARAVAAPPATPVAPAPALAPTLAPAPAPAPAPTTALPSVRQPVWRSQFRQGLADWGRLRDDWGHHNHRFLAEPGVAGQLLRVQLQRGGIDPDTMARRGLPRSGTGFKAAVIAGGSDSATLRYRLRFAPGFDFVRGGKLPGLYGGRGPSGGVLPQGDDGFSLRLMWREAGAGEVYAYLPGMAQRHGLSLLRGRLQFVPGRWHQLTQQLLLNTPGQDDGVLRMWLDGTAVGEVGGLRLRDSARLRVDGVFVDVFFGGSDDGWAASADTHVDLAEFTLVAPVPVAEGGR